MGSTREAAREAAANEAAWQHALNTRRNRNTGPRKATR